jgi:hypothetical protein
VAAAPFTGGASLSLLLPIGAVGAIPSAYRLANRAEAGTLRMDLATAMDVINIVGGVAGLGEAVTPLGRVWLGRALMITGVGANGAGVIVMGAQMVEQIEALKDLPASVRAARMMEIMGSAMVQVGIAVGASVAERARATEIAAGTPPSPDAAGPARPSTGGGEPARPSTGGGEPTRPSTGGGEPTRPGAGGGEPTRPGAGGGEPARPGRPAETGTPDAPAIVVRASADGVRTLKVTDRGRLAVCSSPCAFLADRYSAELARRPDLRQRLADLEATVARAGEQRAAGTIDAAAHDTQVRTAMTEAVALDAALRLESQRVPTRGAGGEEGGGTGRAATEADLEGVTGVSVTDEPTAGAARRPVEAELADVRRQLDEYGRRPGRSQQATQMRKALDDIATGGSRRDVRTMLDSIKEIMTNERVPTRGETVPAHMSDAATRAAFDDALRQPALEGNPAWDAYVELVKARYEALGTVEVGRSPRSSDPAHVAGTDEMRARFVAGLDSGGVLPEVADMVRNHLSRAVREAGSPAGAVAAGDAVWVNRLTGASASGPGPNVVLWPADPVWGVWRVDHIVELQHGGADAVSNYVPAPQRMHALKSEAMNAFGRAVRAESAE